MSEESHDHHSTHDHSAHDHSAHNHGAHDHGGHVHGHAGHGPVVHSAPADVAVSYTNAVQAAVPAPGCSVVKVDLEAGEIDWEFVKGQKTRAWGFNGQVPGPVLEANVGLGTKLAKVLATVEVLRGGREPLKASNEFRRH